MKQTELETPKIEDILQEEFLDPLGLSAYRFSKEITFLVEPSKMTLTSAISPKKCPPSLTASKSMSIRHRRPMGAFDSQIRAYVLSI